MQKDTTAEDSILWYRLSSAISNIIYFCDHLATILRPILRQTFYPLRIRHFIHFLPEWRKKRTVPKALSPQKQSL